MILRRATLWIAVALFCLTLGLSAGRALADGLSNTAPSPSLSTPAGQAHFFYLRESYDQGVQKSLKTAIYFPANDPPANNATIVVSKGGDPNAVTCDPATTDPNDPNYITVTLTDGQNAANKTQYSINTNNACQKSTSNNTVGGAGNSFYAPYGLPNIPATPAELDPDTGMYKIKVVIKYSDNIPQPTQPGQDLGFGQRFLLTSVDTAAKIGPLGTNVINGACADPTNCQGSFPVVGAYDLAGTATTIKIPFGLPCSVKKSQQQIIGVYDADNGSPTFAPHDVKFQIQQLTSPGNWTTLDLQDQGYSAYNGKWLNPSTLQPNDNTSTFAGLQAFVLKSNTQYRMIIQDLMPHNTVDVAIPDDSIFGDITCPQTAGWQMNVDSTVSSPTVAPGGTVTFTHRFYNSGASGTSPTTIGGFVGWGDAGYFTGGTSVQTGNNFVTSVTPSNPRGPETYGANGGGKTITDTVLIPANIPTGTLFCQYGRASQSSSTDATPLHGDYVCVTVKNPGGAITIQSLANGTGTYETHTPALLSGGVIVSGFPAGASLHIYCNYNEYRNGQYLDFQQREADVTADGTYCQYPVPSTETGNIGDTIRLDVTAHDPYWNVAPVGTWTFDYEPPNGFTPPQSVASATANMVGFSYLKVYGSDVRTGGGVPDLTKPAGSCNFNALANIETLNRGTAYGTQNYAGSGAQFGVFGINGVNGFASAQYNNYNANPDTGTDPTKLTFANFLSMLGFSAEYGGFYGGPPVCSDYTKDLTPEIGAPLKLYGQTIDSTTPSRLVVGNVEIYGDMVYAGGVRTKVSDIPNYRLVVEGNILIYGGVHRLDGLYVAMPNASGQGGNIYTCTYGSDPVNITVGQGCDNQLVVNGSFVAQHVYFERDCGSLIYANNDEPTVPSGSGDNLETCSATNHAAEVFNYSPEQWLPAAATKPSSGYDAISSLPPVL